MHARPHGMHARPHGMHARPHGMHAPPHGMHARPHGMHAPPHGMHAPPHGMHAPLHGMHARLHEAQYVIDIVSEGPILLYTLGILTPPNPPARGGEPMRCPPLCDPNRSDDGLGPPQAGGNQCVVPPRLRGG